MKKSLRLCLSITASALALWILDAAAQTNSSENSSTAFSLDDHFQRGWHEATTGAGVMFSPFVATKNWPTINYAFAYGQAGYMIDDVRGEGIFRGNFELVPDLFAAGIWQRTGHYIAGWTLWGRYNFVPPGWRVTPYMQLGAGAVLTDISHQIDGQNFNFNLDISLGVRYFIKRNLSLNAEYRYQHISNADTGRHNLGINANGPVLGVSWFF